MATPICLSYTRGPMNPLRFFICSMIFGGALLASAHAQLVHLAFTEGRSNGMIFRATSAQIPWNHTGGYISRLDIWYDVNDPADPTRNVWRANVFAYGLGTFHIVRSHDGPYFQDDFMIVNHYVATGVYEEMEFAGSILDNVTPEPGLPVPPFSVGQYGVYLAGGQSFFDVPDLAEGYGYGAFDRVTASVVQSVNFYPVPEPSTYGLIAVALLGSVIVYQKRRRQPGGACRPDTQS